MHLATRNYILLGPKVEVCCDGVYIEAKHDFISGFMT